MILILKDCSHQGTKILWSLPLKRVMTKEQSNTVGPKLESTSEKCKKSSGLAQPYSITV